MPGPRTTLLIEGPFRELVEELSDHLEALGKAAGNDSPTLKSDLEAPLAQDSAAESEDGPQDDDAVYEARDAVLRILVPASAILNTSQDKDFIAAYNLLIHLVRQSPNANTYLQPVCRSLSTDLPQGSQSKPGLALTVLSTVFNTAEPEDPVRYAILSATLDTVARAPLAYYEGLKLQLASLDGWLDSWRTPAAKRRAIYFKVAQIAREAGDVDDKGAYAWLVKALRTVEGEEAANDESKSVATEALRIALSSPAHFDFADLTALDGIQALRNSEPTSYELLEIFATESLSDYEAFKSSHSGWLEQHGLDDAVLTRKIRLLTLTSLASTGQVAQSRSLPYASIAEGLQIPLEEVEIWVIDVIRAGLVEGKLSQSSKTFLIHRSTHRVFGESQWREVAGRLDMWRNSLQGVLEVIRQEKQALIAQKEQEQRATESKANGVRGGYSRAVQREPVDLD